MSIVEPLSPGHAVQLTLPRSLHVRDPLVIFPFKEFVVELGALLFTEVGASAGTGLDVARGVPFGRTHAVGPRGTGSALDKDTPSAGS